MNGRLFALVAVLVLTLGRHDRRLIFGFPGSGKSTFAEALVSAEYRVLWFDHGRDYAKPGRLVLSPAELDRWPRLLRDPHARIVVQTTSEDGREVAEQFTTVVRRVREARNIIILADELGDYGRFAEGTINSLFRSGATHDGVRSILVAHVATDCPYRCRKMATHVHCFAQPHEEELRALAATYGDDFAEAVQSWRPFAPPVTWIPPHMRREGKET